ncbi:UDP-glycosyltransferase 83A1-like [Triticum aestivum]|uniref:UDP-glycosyltransferase 83A1-like n=1 Tax=Triticum aestivum TaxID=4565 RepID=UPI001D00B608|nr:UDP-glycosyltransferase 83A1-like [Triticum aestivum]
MAANANTLSHSFLEKNYVRDLVSLGVDKWKEEEVWVRLDHGPAQHFRSGFLDTTQFQELADGLALSGRPFLWEVRPDLTIGAGQDQFDLDAFKRRVEGKGLVVGWALQQRVLSQPAVACFVSHCGWNSTVEGVLHGVPFLCWPYFADQFCNQSYVCNMWGIGAKLRRDGRGVVAKEEVRCKVARLLSDDEGVKARAAAWKEVACGSIQEGGSSHGNLLKFVSLLRQQ